MLSVILRVPYSHACIQARFPFSHIFIYGFPTCRFCCCSYCAGLPRCPASTFSPRHMTRRSKHGLPVISARLQRLEDTRARCVVSSTWLTFALLNSTHCHSFRGQENTRARACANYARACQPHDDDLTLYICSYILSQLTQITGLCIMPDERHFVSASFDRMIKLWGTD